MNEWSVLLWMQYTVVVPCLVLSTQSLANYWWRRSMLCVVCLCVFLLFLVSAIHSIRRLPVAVTPSILSKVFSHRNASILYFLTSMILAKHRVQSNWCQFHRDNRILRKFVEWLDFYGHQHFVHATQKQERWTHQQHPCWQKVKASTKKKWIKVIPFSHEWIMLFSRLYLTLFSFCCCRNRICRKMSSIRPNPIPTITKRVWYRRLNSMIRARME